MTFTVTFEQPGLVHAVYEGDLDLQGIQDLMISVGLALKEHDCLLVLSDYRKARLAISITELHGLPKMILQRSREMGLSAYKIKRALVIPAQAYDNFRFLETVSLNNMQTVKIFTEEAEARDWLLKK